MGAYRIDFSGVLVTGDLRRALVLRDRAAEDEKPNISDYFSVLALWLDEVCQRLSVANAPEAAKLQRIIEDLLYLQANYKIKKKNQE